MRDTPPPEFAERVRAEVARLQRQGLTKKQIAERIGCARSALDRYENGTPPREISRLADLAHGFGVTMDYLWGRVDDRHGQVSVDPEVARRLAAMAEEAARLHEAVSPKTQAEQR